MNKTVEDFTALKCTQWVSIGTRAKLPSAESIRRAPFSESVGSGPGPVRRSLREPEGTLSGWAGHV